MEQKEIIPVTALRFQAVTLRGRTQQRKLTSHYSSARLRRGGRARQVRMSAHAS